MVTLTESDVMELLGYRAGARHPVEVLGYAYSTRGMARYRAERPVVRPQVISIVAAVLRETGRYPRELTAETREDGVYAERRGDGRFVVHFSAEVAMSRFERFVSEFDAADAAAADLVGRTAPADYV